MKLKTFIVFRSLSSSVLRRILFVAILVIVTHQFAWGWLRFLTSEAVLRASAFLGMVTERESFDTIRIHGQSYCFVVSCTFVDALMGAIPLVWNFKKSMSGNILALMVWIVSLFCFNVSRLEVTQVLLAQGTPWVIAHDILSGIAYFAVWLAISRWARPFSSSPIAPLRTSF